MIEFTQYKIMYRNPKGVLRTPNNPTIANRRYGEHVLALHYCAGINDYRDFVCNLGESDGRFVLVEDK